MLIGEVFTFGGPNGFQAQYRRPRAQNTNQPETPTSPFVALLPILILFAFALISIVPSILSGTTVPDPEFAWEPSTRLDTGRNTWHWGVPYFVNRPEWEGSSIWQSVPEARRPQRDAAKYSQKVRSFERGVENHYARKLQNEVRGHLPIANSFRLTVYQSVTISTV